MAIPRCAPAPNQKFKTKHPTQTQVFAAGLGALQHWLDRLGKGLERAGLSAASPSGGGGMRAEEISQLVQAHRLSFALASVALAFVLAMNITMACGLRQVNPSTRNS